MCGIVGLFCKSPELEPRLGALPRGDARADGRPRAGQRRRRRLPRPGAGRLEQAHALLGRRRDRLGRRAGELGEAFGVAEQPSARAPRRRRSSRATPTRPRRGCARASPGAARDERRPRDRDLQGGRPPARVRRAVRARRLPGHARPRPHADGDREPRHDRGLASVLDRPRPLPRPQRLALEPQPAARASCGARASRSRPRTTPRSPPATSTWRLREGATLEAGARGLPRRPRRLLHVPRRHRRRLRGAARPDRLQAGRARRDRRLGRDGVRVPRDRRAPGRRRTRGSGSPSRRVVYAWEKALAV